MSQELRLLLKHRTEWLASGRLLVLGAPSTDIAELDEASGATSDFFFADHAAFSASVGALKSRAFAGVWHTEAAGYHRALVFLPKSNSRRDMWLANAAQCLVPEGEVTLVGQKSHGIKSARPAVSRFFAHLQGEAYGYHSHLFTAKQPQPEANRGLDAWLEAWMLERGERRWSVTTTPGIFSQGRLDEGTSLLLEAMKLPEAAAVLDVGCGAGVLGLVAATEWRPSRVVLADVDYAAVFSARRTLEAASAGITCPIEVIASDVYSEVGGVFDVVLSNPPFHQGMENDQTVPARIIEGAPKLLKRGGELWLVANSFLPYPAVLDRAFGSHRVVTRNGRFTVYRAVRT